MYVNGNCWYRQATTAVHSKHIIITVTQMLFLGMWWVRTKNSEWLIQESDTSRNSTCNIIVHWLYGRFIRTRRNEQYLQENDIWEWWIEVSLCWACFWTYASLFAIGLVSSIIPANGDSYRAINPSCLPILVISWPGNRIAIFVTKAKASRNNPTGFIQKYVHSRKTVEY